MNNPTETKKIAFPGKWTYAGAKIAYHIFDQNGKEILPKKIYESRTKMNWTDEFEIQLKYPYILVSVNISNTLKHSCRIDQLYHTGDMGRITPISQGPFKFTTIPCPCLASNPEV